MELVEGNSLDRLIPEGGLPIEQILDIANAIAEALAAAHEKGIVHRDLKPANVMLTNDGRVKVLDFGIAKIADADQALDATQTLAGHTAIGVAMGTPAYMSPEQIAGRAVDHRSDIFSLGIILYQMASGRRPFEGRSPAELASAILRDTPRPLSEARADLPADLSRIIRRCLEKDPSHRFQTARDVSNELRDVIATLHPPRTPAVLEPIRSASAGEGTGTTTRFEQGFWIAVLPFKYHGSNSDLTALAEGLSEEIVTGLFRFSYLKVVARGSTLRYAGEATDLRTVGKELGARYVMEGNVRQAGPNLRIAVQLVDANSGTALWAETYNRTFRPEDIFALQDDVVPRIVSTVADTQGVLPHTMSELLRKRDPASLSPYESILRGFAHFQRVNAEEHAAARAALERAVQQAPDQADCWAMLSMIYKEEYTHGFNVLPDPLGRALAAARRAVEAAPSNHLAYHALAAAQFFRHEIPAFRIAAEKAIALNPMDGFTAAYIGFLLAYSGEWDRGCALTQLALRLNPHSPGWYWFASFFDAYRKSDYPAALDFALKVNMPGFWRTNFALAAVYGQLGEQESARNAVHQLLILKPNFTAEAREELAKWWDPQLIEHLIDGLHKAGLEIPPVSS
jgi:TolB-like protein